MPWPASHTFVTVSLLALRTLPAVTRVSRTPSVIADRAFDKAVWGDHPYARPAEGTSKDLAGAPGTTYGPVSP